MNIRLSAILLVIFMMHSCASYKLVVSSDTPSRIEMRGVTVCEQTPCEIVKTCFSHGEPTTLEAFPISRANGYTQKKTVRPDCNIGSDNATSVFFDMMSRSGIAIDDSSRNDVENDDNRKKIKKLKEMYDEGLITKDVYLQLLNSLLE